jgi:arylsulfatase B
VRYVLLLLSVALTLQAKPNIILIVADDLGYAELGCQGARDVDTPNIDSLAANGIRFTSGYVSAPVCCPSRAGMMTGRYQTRFGHELNAIGVQNLGEDIGLPLSERTLADLLGAQGYATGLVGKWHLGAHASRHPLQRGFDEFYGFLNEGHYYVPKPYLGVTTWLRITKNPEGPGPRLVRGRFIFSDHMSGDEPTYDLENPILRGVAPFSDQRYLTDALGEEAAEFIGRHSSEPFFLYLAFNAPHSPMQASDAYMKKYAHVDDVHRRIFLAMTAQMDHAVGRVLAKLRSAGVEEDTLVFFVSDNGGPTRELTSSNAPLRDGKGQVYEGGLRVPFLVQWKARLPKGKVDQRPVIALDVAPTALAAAEAPIPTNLDGADLLPYLTGQNSSRPHPTLFFRYGTRIALRQGDWKLVGRYEQGQGVKEPELYNLDADLGESIDLASREPDVLAELQRILADYDAQMVAPLWGPDPRSRSTRTNVPLELLQAAPTHVPQ